MKVMRQLQFKYYWLQLQSFKILSNIAYPKKKKFKMKLKIVCDFIGMWRHIMIACTNFILCLIVHTPYSRLKRKNCRSLFWHTIHYPVYAIHFQLFDRKFRKLAKILSHGIEKHYNYSKIAGWHSVQIMAKKIIYLWSPFHPHFSMSIRLCWN